MNLSPNKSRVPNGSYEHHLKQKGRRVGYCIITEGTGFNSDADKMSTSGLFCFGDSLFRFAWTPLVVVFPYVIYRGLHLFDFMQADSRFVPSQWETALLCNDVSHWLGASQESALLCLLALELELWIQKMYHWCQSAILFRVIQSYRCEILSSSNDI